MTDTTTLTAKPLPAETALTPAPVDLTSLTEADLAKQIKDRLWAMENAFRRSALNAIEAGEALVEAKKRVGHGKFEAWLKDHCQLSYATARRYMGFAKNRSKIEAALNSKSLTMSDLSLNDVQRLIASSKESGSTSGAAT